MQALFGGCDGGVVSAVYLRRLFLFRYIDESLKRTHELFFVCLGISEVQQVDYGRQIPRYFL